MTVLKVAAGVFLGIAAILLVLKIPSWIQNQKEEDAAAVVLSLTPDTVIERCGKPLSDKSTLLDPTDPGSTASREMEYRGANGSRVALEFLSLSSTEGGKGYNWGADFLMSGNGGLIKYDSPESKLEALPCLSGDK